MSRYKGPKCGCSAPKINGRCSATPSCDDFPSVQQINKAQHRHEERINRARVADERLTPRRAAAGR